MTVESSLFQKPLDVEICSDDRIFCARRKKNTEQLTDRPATEILYRKNCFFMNLKTQNTGRRQIVTGWLQIAAGLLIFALGVHLTIYANIGLAPWDCLGMGIAKHTPFNYGISMTIMAVSILLLDMLLKERIGFGTVIDALLTGNFVQMFNNLNPFPENHSLLRGICIMPVGFVFMALGMWVYMRAEQCCGPRDALLVALGKRAPRIPIGIVEILLWAVVLLCGWLLGGPVGIGTLISTFGAGLVMQLVYHLIHFEPRSLHHKDLLKTVRILRQPPAGQKENTI